MSAQRIFIYNGPGTKDTDILLDSVNDMISTCFNDLYDVEFISNLNDGEWTECAKVLILPGGRDLPYVENIKPGTLDMILDFIRKGGSFLGICAGAYFSCSSLEFEMNTSLEVCGLRTLSLFDGIGRGSVYPGFVYNSTCGSRMCPLLINNDSGIRIVHAYHDGGGEFIAMKGDFHDIEVMAHYKDFPEKIAIVKREMGTGRFLLSFVHAEMDVRYLDRCRYSVAQWESMTRYQQQQRKLWMNFWRFLLQ